MLATWYRNIAVLQHAIQGKYCNYAITILVLLQNVYQRDVARRQLGKGRKGSNVGFSHSAPNGDLFFYRYLSIFSIGTAQSFGAGSGWSCCLPPPYVAPWTLGTSNMVQRFVPHIRLGPLKGNYFFLHNVPTVSTIGGLCLLVAGSASRQ